MHAVISGHSFLEECCCKDYVFQHFFGHHVDWSHCLLLSADNKWFCLVYVLTFLKPFPDPDSRFHISWLSLLPFPFLLQVLMIQPAIQHLFFFFINDASICSSATRTFSCIVFSLADSFYDLKLVKLVSAIFYQVFIFSWNGRPSKTMKKFFYFI